MDYLLAHPFPFNNSASADFKRYQMEKIFLSIHTIILSLVSVGFLITIIIDNPRDIVNEDKLELFESLKGKY